MARVIVNRMIKFPYDNSFVEKIARKTEKRAGKLNGEIEINIITAAAMKKINYRYRRINKATDVLSFAWQEDRRLKSDFLGEIYLCYPRIATQAKEWGVPVKEEFARILVHGLLHINGYNHVKRKESETMFAVQEEVVRLLTKKGGL